MRPHGVSRAGIAASPQEMFMRKLALLPLRAQAGARQPAVWLTLALLTGSMASASHAQSTAAHTHHAPASAQASDPQAATARLQHVPLAATPGLTPAQADWRAANQAVADAAQAAMPGMDHSAHGAGQAAAPASQAPKSHAGHSGAAHAAPESATPPAPGHAAHGHPHGAMHPAGATSHGQAVREQGGQKPGGSPPIPQGDVRHPAAHGHTQHRHGGQP